MYDSHLFVKGSVLTENYCLVHVNVIEDPNSQKNLKTCLVAELSLGESL